MPRNVDTAFGDDSLTMLDPAGIGPAMTAADARDITRPGVRISGTRQQMLAPDDPWPGESRQTDTSGVGG